MGVAFTSSSISVWATKVLVILNVPQTFLPPLEWHAPSGPMPEDLVGVATANRPNTIHG